MINVDYLISKAPVSGWGMLGRKWTFFVLRVDTLEARNMGAYKDLSQGPKLPVFLGVPSLQWLWTTKRVLSRDSWRTGNWVMGAKDSAMCVGKEG